MAFERGNKLGAKSRDFEKTLRRAIEQDDWRRVRAGVEKLLDQFAAGEAWALQMVRDTLDGKPKQQIEAVDDEGRPLSIALVTFDSLQAGENKTVDNEIVH
jgi:hypothetical protein